MPLTFDEMRDSEVHAEGDGDEQRSHPHRTAATSSKVTNVQRYLRLKLLFFHWVTRKGFLLSISLDRCQLSQCFFFFFSPRKGQRRWNKWSSQEFLLPFCCSGTRRDNGETPRGSRSNGDCARQTVSVALEQRRCLTDKDEPRSSPAALEPPIHRTNGEIQMGGTLSVYFKRRSFCSDVEQVQRLNCSDLPSDHRLTHTHSLLSISVGEIVGWPCRGETRDCCNNFCFKVCAIYIKLWYDRPIFICYKVKWSTESATAYLATWVSLKQLKSF